jgi:hypothetical protein
MAGIADGPSHPDHPDSLSHRGLAIVLDTKLGFAQSGIAAAQSGIAAVVLGWRPTKVSGVQSWRQMESYAFQILADYWLANSP